MVLCTCWHVICMEECIFSLMKGSIKGHPESCRFVTNRNATDVGSQQVEVSWHPAVQRRNTCQWDNSWDLAHMRTVAYGRKHVRWVGERDAHVRVVCRKVDRPADHPSTRSDEFLRLIVEPLVRQHDINCKHDACSYTVSGS